MNKPFLLLMSVLALAVSLNFVAFGQTTKPEPTVTDVIVKIGSLPVAQSEQSQLFGVLNQRIAAGSLTVADALLILADLEVALKDTATPLSPNEADDFAKILAELVQQGMTPAEAAATVQNQIAQGNTLETIDQAIASETKESTEKKESAEVKEAKESKESKESTESKETPEVKEPTEQKETPEVKEPAEKKEAPETKEPAEQKESKEDSESDDG